MAVFGGRQGTALKRRYLCDHVCFYLQRFFNIAITPTLLIPTTLTAAAIGINKVTI